MPTDHQQYSTANQAQAIREYAARHGFRIEKTHEHSSKSGLNLDDRQALKQLIEDVQNGAAEFATILVYDVSAVTFSCVRAGLNAAARKAAKAPSQGSYQFSRFDIIKDTHHSFYEVHFKSNYSGEPNLKYCVAIYGQQGWDPNTAQISVSPMSNERKRPLTAAHETGCGNEKMPARRLPKR